MLRDRVSASTIGAIYDRISPAVEDAMIATLKTFGQAVPDRGATRSSDTIACQDPICRSWIA